MSIPHLTHHQKAMEQPQNTKTILGLLFTAQKLVLSSLFTSKSDPFSYSVRDPKVLNCYQPFPTRKSFNNCFGFQQPK